MPVMRTVIIKIGMIISLVAGIVFLGLSQPKHVDKIVAQVEQYIILDSELQKAYRHFQSNGYKTTKCNILKNLLIEKMLMVQANKDTTLISEQDTWDYLDKKVHPCGLGVKDYSNYREKLKKKYYAYFREKLVIKKMSEHIESKVKITPKEVKDYFNTIPQDSLPFIPDQVEVGQIVMLLKPTRQEKHKIRHKIEKLRERILNGESFEEIARKYSEDYSCRYSCWQTFRPFELNTINHIKNLKIGEISGVVEISNGYIFTQLLEVDNSQNLKKYKYRNIFLSFKSIKKDTKPTFQTLDSLRGVILNDKSKFKRIASVFSEDKNTISQGGILIDSKTGNTKVSIHDLDSYLYLTLDTMKVGSISKPQLYHTNDGQTAMRIIYFKSKVPGHTVNLQKDYFYIRQAALSKKKSKAIISWFNKTKHKFFVNVIPEYQDCMLLKK